MFADEALDGVEVVCNCGPPLILMAAAVLTALIVVAFFAQPPIASRPRPPRPTAETLVGIAERVARRQLLGELRPGPGMFQIPDTRTAHSIFSLDVIGFDILLAKSINA